MINILSLRLIWSLRIILTLKVMLLLILLCEIAKQKNNGECEEKYFSVGLSKTKSKRNVV